MAKGRKPGCVKTGGRKKGSIDKGKQDLIARIKERFPNYCPVEAMCVIGQDNTEKTELRLTAHKEVAQYIYPKLKAIEHSNKDGNAMIVQVMRFGDSNNTQ